MQTEEKIHRLEEDIQNAEKSIVNRQNELHTSREKWESERSALESSRRSQRSTKSSLDIYLQQFHGEKLAINARKERLTSREVKLKGDLESLEAAERKKDEESDDRSKRRQEARHQLIKERQATQVEQILQVEQMESSLAEIKERTARTHSERVLLESMPLTQQSSIGIADSPTLSPPSPFVGIHPIVQEGFRQMSGEFEEMQDSPVDNSLAEFQNYV